MLRLDPIARVRRHIEEILGDGPISFDDLEDSLTESGLNLGPHPDERIDDVLGTMERIDWLHPSEPDDGDDTLALCFDWLALLDGTTWTVPIGDVDLASDTVPGDALGLLFMLLINGWCEFEHGATIDTGAEGRRREAAQALGVESEGGVGLPHGWLGEQGARAGGFLLLRLDGEVVHAHCVDTAPKPTPALVDALAGAIEAESPSGGCRHLTDVLTEVFVVDTKLRGVEVPPLADLIEAAGLVRDGGYVARAPFDFESERIRRNVEEVADSRGFSESEMLAYASLSVAWAQWSAQRERIESSLLQPAALALQSPQVANAFVDEERFSGDSDEIVTFGAALMDAVNGRDRVGPAWLVAQAHGMAGRTDQFESWTDTALALDGDHILALYDKAWFEFDRGEARRAKALLERLGVGVMAHDLAILNSVLIPARPTVGRNERCPCGSGRKYKQCHLGVDEVPLDSRLTWLYRKANWWLELRHRAEVDTMAWLRARNNALSPRQLLETDPLIADAVLTEGGRFEEWLAERGELLPSDEALLAAQWALIDRSVFEVTDIRSDEGMTLRDVRTGDVVDVQERLGTRSLKVGRYLLTRVLPTGTGGHQIFGGITHVPDPMLHRFIEMLDAKPTPAQLLLLVAAAEAPPTLLNTDGHATVFCETTWQVADVDSAIATLDAMFDRSEGAEQWTWLRDSAFDTTDDPAAGRTVLGTLTLDDAQLTATTNSDERAEAISDLMEDLLPGAVLVDTLRSDAEEIRNDLAYERSVFDEENEPSMDMFDPAQAPPELQAAIRQQMDQHEEQWVDESIPALGGITPRQAVDDPTRRDDLFRLLDRMEEMDTRLTPDQRALGMRTSRLRELLGLPSSGDPT